MIKEFYNKFIKEASKGRVDSSLHLTLSKTKNINNKLLDETYNLKENRIK